MSQEEKSDIAEHPIFGALTRPAMTAGVTFEYHGINLMVSMCAFIALNNIFYGLIFFPLHLMGWLLCKYDVNLFTLLYKRIALLPLMPNQRIWGGRVYEPF